MVSMVNGRKGSPLWTAAYLIGLLFIVYFAWTGGENLLYPIAGIAGYLSGHALRSWKSGAVLPFSIELAVLIPVMVSATALFVYALYGGPDPQVYRMGATLLAMVSLFRFMGFLDGVFTARAGYMKAQQEFIQSVKDIYHHHTTQEQDPIVEQEEGDVFWTEDDE